MDNSADLRKSIEAAFEEPQDTPEIPINQDESDLPDAEQDSPADSRARDESGKFVKTEEKPQEQQLEQEPPKPAKRPPGSLKREVLAKWEKLDPDVQDEFLRRESDFHNGINAYKSKAEAADKFEQAYKPYEANIRALGITPDVAVAELFKADHLLRTSAPHQKAAYFAQLAQTYGIDLGMVQNPPRVDPQYQALTEELHALRNNWQREQESRQQAELAQLNSTIAKFAEGREHFEAVRDDMAALLQAGRASDLETAYDMAIWARPDLRQQLLETQRKEAAEKAAQEERARRAKAASSSVRGSSPVASTVSQPGTIREALERAISGG